MHFLETILFLVAVAWVAVAVYSLYNFLGITILRPTPHLEAMPLLPRVSIMLAARNEQETLPATLDSLLKLDYPNYEIILVDDDSEDRTGAIADEWMARPEAQGKLRVIHNRELPPGWRGKVHALSLAEKAATGEWVLATDADVVFHPSLLHQAMNLALQKDVQLLSLTPELEMQSLAEKVVMPAFGLLLFLIFPPRLVNRADSKRALAAGAFILMRRQILEFLGGYAMLRGTLIEDMRMAELFKHHGQRIHLAVTRGVFHTRMYKNWREVFEGLVRSAWEGSGRSLGKVLGGVVLANVLTVLPWIALASLLLHHGLRGPSPQLGAALLAAAAAAGVSVLTYYPVVTYAGLAPWYALSLPLASIFYSVVSITSALSSLAGPGVRWKGRRYQSPPP